MIALQQGGGGGGRDLKPAPPSSGELTPTPRAQNAPIQPLSQDPARGAAGKSIQKQLRSTLLGKPEN